MPLTLTSCKSENYSLSDLCPKGALGSRWVAFPRTVGASNPLKPLDLQWPILE